MGRPSMSDLRKHFSPDIVALNPELFGAEVASARPEEIAARPVTRANKYGAKKVTIGTEVFDSRAEARRWLDLREQERHGEISELMRQCRIVLLEGFVYQGNKVQPITYTADFVYWQGGVKIIEDLKSSATARTEAFRLRWRLLQWHFKDDPTVKCVVTEG